MVTHAEECRGSTPPDFIAAPDHLHDFLAGGICGASVERNSHPLGSDSVEGNVVTHFLFLCGI